jgi:DNA (cytosine-5)-methyltransferase 1
MNSRLHKKEPVEEIFCGPGGMAHGFGQFFDITHAVDFNEPVVQTYQANHPETQVRKQDIRHMTGARGDFAGITAVFGGVIGGPPCQGSSIMNAKRCPEDSRNELMGDFIRYVEEVNPRFFVMENVPEIDDRWKNMVITRGEKAGFTVVATVLNAADYGAAQKRRRLIIVGIKGKAWIPPAKTGPRTVRNAFSRLENNWGFMKSRPDTLEKLARAVPDRWTAMTDKYRNMIKLDYDAPSPAVANIKKMYMVHPAECRNITLAEAALLQGFPSGYTWKGCEHDISQMIADAMPTDLSYALARTLAKGMTA